jgi:hypothetical protein
MPSAAALAALRADAPVIAVSAPAGAIGGVGGPLVASFAEINRDNLPTSLVGGKGKQLAELTALSDLRDAIVPPGAWRRVADFLDPPPPLPPHPTPSRPPCRRGGDHPRVPHRDR